MHDQLVTFSISEKNLVLEKAHLLFATFYWGLISCPWDISWYFYIRLKLTLYLIYPHTLFRSSFYQKSVHKFCKKCIRRKGIWNIHNYKRSCYHVNTKNVELFNVFRKRSYDQKRKKGFSRNFAPHKSTPHTLRTLTCQ